MSVRSQFSVSCFKSSLENMRDKESLCVLVTLVKQGATGVQQNTAGNVLPDYEPSYCSDRIQRGFSFLSEQTMKISCAY